MIKLPRHGFTAAVMAVILTAGAGAPGAGALEPPAAQTVRAGDAALGGAIARERCSGCHAIAAAGTSSHAGAPAFRDLSRTYPVESLGEAFAEGVVVGHSQMPEFELSQTEIKDLLAYLESIQTEAPGGR